MFMTIKVELSIRGPKSLQFHLINPSGNVLENFTIQWPCRLNPIRTSGAAPSIKQAAEKKVNILG